MEKDLRGKDVVQRWRLRKRKGGRMIEAKQVLGINQFVYLALEFTS
jgi:hypothetical protein